MSEPHFEEELVNVSLIREDLRQLLMAADSFQRMRMDNGEARMQRVDLAIKRIGDSAQGWEWQPKPRA